MIIHPNVITDKININHIKILVDFSLTNGRITLANKNTMTYSGIGIYNPIIFSDIKSKKYKLSEILLKNIIKDKVSGSTHTDIWFDVGDVKKLKNVNELFF